MPDAGPAAPYTDWHRRGVPVRPRWEDYHVGELVPWVDARFRTVAGRRGRAIAGLSMGGLGALSYAARHPRTFVAAASFSGALEIGSDAAGGPPGPPHPPRGGAPPPGPPPPPPGPQPLRRSPP